MFDKTRKSSASAREIPLGEIEKLCFEKNDFMKEDFSTDNFLQTYRNVPTLEQLRDDLGLYLKGLRTAMIDLINEDYADFVSLSVNLVGLDSSIKTIREPLKVIHDNVENLQNFISMNALEIRAHLDSKREINETRRNLLALRALLETSEKLENLLKNQLNNKIHAIDLERAALELIQVKFNRKFCEVDYLEAEDIAKIEKLEKEILEKLRQLFIEALKSSTSTSTELLERCLRIYSTLDAHDTAEAVFRKDVVEPYMSAIITEQSLQNSPQGLAGIYSKILNFISLHMTDLLRLTQYTDKFVSFNFLVNSFWLEVEARIETNLSSIFAPGNSEIFYVKYKCTREFLLKLEELLAYDAEAIKNFRQHKNTIKFLNRWNLPVYFQICFQEIAGEFEKQLEPLLGDNTLNTETVNNSNKFQLLPFDVAHVALKRCWSEGIYLEEIFPKFYKLNMQILVRLMHWVDDVIKLTTSTKNPIIPKKLNKTTLLIAMHADIKKLKKLLPELKQEIVNNIQKNAENMTAISAAIDKSFKCNQNLLNTHLETITNALVNILINESCLDNLRQVNDLPRLFRKTNRELPTRASAYVEQMLRPLKEFAFQQTKNLGDDFIAKLLPKVFDKITTDYVTVVNDVLTSVQKTEESLRRLRNLKQNAAAGAATTNVGVTDDDKIRLQLRVDVKTWTSEIEKMGLQTKQIIKLQELNKIVEESLANKQF